MSNSETTSSPGKVRIRAVRGGLPATVISAALVVSGVLFATTSTGAATTYVSQSTGRFLTGSIGGTSLDTIAGIEGEAAQNDGSTAVVVNSNSLQAEVLNNAIQVPLQNGLQLPGLNVLQLGAVGQYSKAVNDGAALGASGAVTDQGGIALGGSSAAPANAKLDLSGLGGSAIANTLGNLKLEIGALSAQAAQLAGTNGMQSGDYQVAGLKVSLTSPALAQGVAQLTGVIQTAVNSVAGVLGSLPVINTVVSVGCPATITLTTTCVGGLSDITSLTSELTSLSVANGAVTASLTDGAITIDLAKLLQELGLDLNNLDPNTSLVPYLSKALSELLPAALTSAVTTLVSDLEAKFNALQIVVLGQTIDTNNVLFQTINDALTNQIITPLTDALSSGAAQLGSGVFTPLAEQLAALLDLIVNAQSTSGGKFSETALQILIGSGAGSTPISLPTGIPTTFAALPTTNAYSARALGAPAAPAAVAARPVVAAPKAAAPAVVPAAPVDASSALVALNLANATVGPSAAIPATPTSSAVAIPTPSGATPTATSSIHIQSGGGLAPVALSPIKHDDNRRPLGITLAALGLVGLAWPRRRRLAELVARAR